MFFFVFLFYSFCIYFYLFILHCVFAHFFHLRWARTFFASTVCVRACVCVCVCDREAMALAPGAGNDVNVDDGKAPLGSSDCTRAADANETMWMRDSEAGQSQSWKARQLKWNAASHLVALVLVLSLALSLTLSVSLQMATEKRRRRCRNCLRDSLRDCGLRTARPRRRFENPTRTENETELKPVLLETRRNAAHAVCAFQSSWQRDHRRAASRQERESESDTLVVVVCALFHSQRFVSLCLESRAVLPPIMEAYALSHSGSWLCAQNETGRVLTNTSAA